MAWQQVKVKIGKKSFDGMLEDKSRLEETTDNFEPDIIVHLAAQAGVRYSIENPAAYIKSNIKGFSNILEGCRHNKVNHLIYASRMDNGDTASGVGWRLRGGRILQLTGRYNYTQFGKAVDMTPEEACDYVRTKKGALDSACWFWDTNNINKWCDDMDVVGATKRINGGTIGLDDRKKHYLHASLLYTSDAADE